jgi:hypothetical protein
MYYPYFRGKKNELKLLRERASFIANNNIHPILEPVRENVSPLSKTLKELAKYEVQLVLVVNPQNGELKTNPQPILKLSQDQLKGYVGLSLGYIVTAQTDKSKLKEDIQRKSDYSASIIHYGYADGNGLATSLQGLANIKEHIFIEGYAGKLYRKHFKNGGKPHVLIRDGFQIRKNETYPDTEHFSDLHLTYTDEGVQDFGDFLIVGEKYMDRGFAAYAVAIHLTYLDQDNDMHIRHFVSDRSGSTADQAGKFLEALNKLVAEINRSGSHIYHSEACGEYTYLHKIGHFPGLGYLKKLSMQHHLELIANYLSR